MTDLQKFQRVCRVFLARLLAVYGPAAPDLLRRMADEIEWLRGDYDRDVSQFWRIAAGLSVA